MSTGATLLNSSVRWLRARPSVWVSVVALWLVACVLGLLLMNRHAFTAGPVTGTVAAWPASSRIDRDPSRPTLVMFAHPLCPCTQASMAELAEVVAATAGKAQVYVVFFETAGAAGRAQDSAAWQAAAEIPNVLVGCDAGAQEARRFGARTSGQTLLFDASGRLLFSGGITPSRGHVGENAGSEALIGWLNEGHAVRSYAPVFGCAIFGDDAETDR